MLALILLAVMVIFGVLEGGLSLSFIIITKVSEFIAELTGGNKEKISTGIIITLVIAFFSVIVITSILGAL